MLEINFKHKINLIIIEIAKKHFSFSLLTYSNKDYWIYKALFQIAITDDIFCFQFFFKEYVIWNKEGGWF